MSCMFPSSFTTRFNETVSRTQESVDGNQIYVSMVLNLQVLYTVILQDMLDERNLHFGDKFDNKC